MLIPTIEFDVTNFTTGESTHHIVENTEDNWELIAHSRNTRNIEFNQTFDFQFTNLQKELGVPKFIQFGSILLDALTHCLADGETDYELASTNEDVMA